MRDSWSEKEGRMEERMIWIVGRIVGSVKGEVGGDVVGEEVGSVEGEVVGGGEGEEVAQVGGAVMILKEEAIWRRRGCLLACFLVLLFGRNCSFVIVKFWKK
jgi:hypothetical protein